MNTHEVAAELLAFLATERALENKGWKWIQKNVGIEEQTLEQRAFNKARSIIELLESYEIIPLSEKQEKKHKKEMREQPRGYEKELDTLLGETHEKLKTGFKIPWDVLCIMDILKFYNKVEALLKKEYKRGYRDGKNVRKD